MTIGVLERTSPGADLCLHPVLGVVFYYAMSVQSRAFESDS